METKSKGKWDTKRAKAARKAFERLVRSQGWLEATKSPGGQKSIEPQTTADQRQ
jgi:hypothetical protein